MQEKGANAHQIGGTHYRSEFQHWDLVVETRTGYLEGCITKYVVRWRRKNGLEDLRKAHHYLCKLIEVAQLGYSNRNSAEPQILENYFVANEVPSAEQSVMHSVFTWQDARDLEQCTQCARDIDSRCRPGCLALFVVGSTGRI